MSEVKTFEVKLVLTVQSHLDRAKLKHQLWNLAEHLEGVADVDIESVFEVEAVNEKINT